MKRILYLLVGLVWATAFSACQDDESEVYVTYPLTVQLSYEEGENASTLEGIQVKLTNKVNNTVYDTFTDASGIARFNVPAGVYEAAASGKQQVGAGTMILNGIKSNIAITSEWTGAETVSLALTASQGGSLVIKELYVGGCQKDDGSGPFRNDKYVILYNNSDITLDISDVCLGMVLPYNSTAANRDYVNGELIYEKEGWVPAGTGVWYFQGAASLEAGKQIVIALTNAVDNTQTYSNSINFSNPEYYCTYDIEQYPNVNYYPSPVETIPTSHYLKAHHYGTGNAWPLSNTCPAFYIFAPQGTTLDAFIADAGNIDLYGGLATQKRKKLPVKWVIDGIEVFNKDKTENYKRLTATIDAGSIALTGDYGYSLYRNVDKAATEALEMNQGKLVYGYSLGQDSTDPSGIDAEASLKNGARIIYQDTNNSSRDFHQRSKASLRD